MAQLLGNVTEGTLVKLKENGTLVDFYVAKHDYESSLNGSGRTLVVRKDTYDDRVWDSGNVNAYASSDLDSWFNSTYKNMLDADIRSLIGTTKIHYTPGNGNNTVGTLERAIFALSLTELGQSHTYANTEGSALPIASTLRIAYHNGSATTQWTRSPHTNYPYSAIYLSSNGDVYGNFCTLTYGSRPAFTLPSSLYVSDDGSVSQNTAPSTPASISVPPHVNEGGSVSVSWTASTDLEGNLSGYTLQRSVNGGGYVQVYQGAGTSFTDTAPSNADTLQYRVQAYDSEGLTSRWRTSSQVQVYEIPTLTVPEMVMQGQSATVSWSEVGVADSYILQRLSSADTDWTQVYAGANTTYTETVGTWTSLQYRVCAVFEETSGGWATSGDIQIVSASALVISGSDGDLGTLTSDVSWSVSSDQTSPVIEVTVTVNGGEYASFQATSGQNYSIGVLDLPTGTGSIVITASTVVSEAPVTVTRTWTYTKAAQSFLNAGSVARLTQEGDTIWPQTLAEAVRTTGGPWGGDLSKALNLLQGAAVYHRTAVPKYSEVSIDLSTATVGQEISLPVNGVMTPHIVVHIGNPDPELYDASCDGVWLLRKDIVENGPWNASNVNTLDGSTIMTTMQGYVDDYDETVQAAIKTVKIPYCVGGGNWTIQSLGNGLECKIFPLCYYEIGGSDGNVPVDGAKLDYFLPGGNEPSANAKRIFNYNGAPSNVLLRSLFKINTHFCSACGSNGILGQWDASSVAGYLPCFIMQTTFQAIYLVDTDGNVHPSQEYTAAGDFSDLWGNDIPTVRIGAGRYTGTGAYGQSNPNMLTFSFVPKIVFISFTGVASETYSGLSIPFISSCRSAIVFDNRDGSNTRIDVSWSGQNGTPENSVSWYGNSPATQLNINGITYQYIALG